jgi:hypothetical protein
MSHRIRRVRGMDLWSPPRDAPHLLEWWRPLMLVGRRARLDRFPWPVHLDDFRLAGRVVRQGRPDIWIYEHHDNGGSVCADATGQTYKFTATPRAQAVGRFLPCDVRTALWRARLPEVVEPIFFRDEVPNVRPDDTWGGDAGSDFDTGSEIDDDGIDDGIDDELVDASDGARVVRRGHLTLIAG